MKILFRLSSVSLVTATTILGISSQVQAGVFTSTATNSGSYTSGNTKPTNVGYLTGKNSASNNTEHRSYFIFNIPVEMNAAYRTITGSKLILANPANGYVGPSRTFNVTNVTTPISLLQNGGTATQNQNIFVDLGTAGGVYGTASVSTANNNRLLTVDLGTNAYADIRNKAGSSFALGGALTLDGTARQVLFNGSSNTTGTRQLEITFADAQAATNGNQQFGNVLVGQSRSVNLTVTNTGEVGSQLSGSIGASSNPFITPTSGSQSFTNLGAGQSATRTFTFTPTERSQGTAQQATIAISSNTKNAIANPLFTGFGVAAQNALSSVNNNAGYVRIGTQASLGLNLQNVGDGNLSGLGAISNLNGSVSLTGSSSDFSATSGSLGALSLGDNVVKAINFIYKPTDHGADNQVLTLNFTNGSDDGTNQAQVKTVNLTGYGVGPQFQSSSAPNSTLDFGRVQVGETRLLSLVITNATSDPTNDPQLTGLTLLDSLFEGSGAEAFSLLNFTPGTVLAAGESLELLLEFNPLYAGDFSEVDFSILTDQGTAFKQAGQSFNFKIKAAAVPEPNSVFGFLAVVGAGVLLPKKSQIANQLKNYKGEGNH